MSGLLQDIRFSVRVLARSPGSTTVALMAPALGIGANAVTFVGIVGDTKDWFTGAPDATVYVLNDQMPQWTFQLAVRTRGDPAKALAAVRSQAPTGRSRFTMPGRWSSRSTSSFRACGCRPG